MQPHIQALAQSDERLLEIIAIIPEPKIVSTQDVFFDLMSCLIEQQIHYRSTKKLFAKMLEKAQLKHLTVANFPIFEAKALSQAKLSMQKYDTIMATVQFFDAHKVDWFSSSNEEVHHQLSTIKGVGTWTIDMLLIYTLQRPDIFPSDDYHLKQIMTQVYGLNPNARLKAQMTEVAMHWGNNQSLAVLYLLAWKAYQR